MADKEKKMEERNAYEYDYFPDFMDRETTFQKFWRFAKEMPYVVIALGGGFGIFCHGLYNIRNRGIGRPVSQYLIHYRVYVQGFMVWTMIIGATLHAAKNWYVAQKDLKNKQLKNPRK